MDYIGVIVLRNEDMPIDIMIVDGFLCISFRLAKKLAEY